jgi:hypothetical protein
MAKYIKDFNTYKKDHQEDILIEGWLADTMKSASAAIKGFMGSVTAPFKNAIKDFKKGMDNEKIKTSLSNTLDTAFKNANKSVDAIKDETDLAKVLPDFQGIIQQLGDQLQKEIANIKESKIFEANAQDSLIGAKVILNMVTNKMTKLKQKFDIEVAKAKDIATKKAAVKKQLTDMYTQIKTEIKNLDIDALVKDYKDKNKITANQKSVILDWGDVEVEITNLSPEELKKVGYDGYGFKVIKSGSKKLLADDVVKIAGTAKKGDKVKMTEIHRNGAPFKIENKDFYETGLIEKFVVDGKEVDEYNFGGENQDPNADLKDKLTKIKDDKDKMGIVGKLVNNIDNPDKIKQVIEILDKE